MEDIKKPWQVILVVIITSIFAIVCLMAASITFVTSARRYSFLLIIILFVYIAIGIGILILNYYIIKGKKWPINLYKIIFVLILIIGILGIIIPLLLRNPLRPFLESWENMAYILIPTGILGLFLCITSLKHNYYSLEVQVSLQTRNNSNLISTPWQKIVLEIISLIITGGFCFFIAASSMMVESFGNIDIWDYLAAIGILFGAILFTIVTINIFQEKKWVFKFYYWTSFLVVLVGIIFFIYIIIDEYPADLSEIMIAIKFLIVLPSLFGVALNYLAKKCLQKTHDSL